MCRFEVDKLQPVTNAKTSLVVALQELGDDAI